MTDLLAFMLVYGSVFSLGAAGIARITVGTGAVDPESRAPRALLPVAKVVKR